MRSSATRRRSKRHRFMLGMLDTIGIRKGEPFAPDARMEALLMKAAKLGWSEMQVACFANPRPERLVWQNRKWEYVPLAGPVNRETKDFGTANYRDLLANDFYFFMAWGTSASIGKREAGPGSLYFYTPRDSSGAYLDGGKSYKLNVPGPFPLRCSGRSRSTIPNSNHYRYGSAPRFCSDDLRKSPAQSRRFV